MKCDINKSLNFLGLILVPINVNGNTHVFLLDTGAQNNCICDTSRECMECFEPSGDSIVTHGIDDHTIESAIGHMVYEIGGHTCKASFHVISGRTFDSIAAETGIEISGILGITFMKKHRCTINIFEGYVTAEFDENTSLQESTKVPQAA